MHWRETMRPARFLIFDARAAWALLLFIVHIEWWTLFIAITVMSTLLLFERKGLTVAAAMLAIRAWFAGRLRPATPWWKRRKLIDYGA